MRVSDQPSSKRGPLVLALLIWLVTAFVISGVVVSSHGKSNRRSVTPNYRRAVERWVNGRPLYIDAEDGDPNQPIAGSGFIYPPPSLIFFLPFWGPFPDLVADLLWRWIGMGVLAYSLWRLCETHVRQTALLPASSVAATVFLILTVVTIPLSWDSFRNGQITVLMTGLLVLGTVALMEQRWWWAATTFALAVIAKPIALPLLLIAAVLRPVLLPRLLVIVGLLAVAPFAMQWPAYVVEQFVACRTMLQRVKEVGDHRDEWAQLFCALKVLRLVDVPEWLRDLARILMAGVSFLAAAWVRWRTPSARWPFAWLTIATCYILLFNPRTENNTYALASPVYGLFLADAWQQRRWGAVSFLGLITLMTVAGHELFRQLMPPPYIWHSPLGCCLFAGYAAIELYRESRRTHAVGRPSSAAVA